MKITIDVSDMHLGETIEALDGHTFWRKDTETRDGRYISKLLMKIKEEMLKAEYLAMRAWERSNNARD
jgi:hypothetical protein